MKTSGWVIQNCRSISELCKLQHNRGGKALSSLPYLTRRKKKLRTRDRTSSSEWKKEKKSGKPRLVFLESSLFSDACTLCTKTKEGTWWRERTPINTSDTHLHSCALWSIGTALAMQGATTLRLCSYDHTSAVAVFSKFALSNQIYEKSWHKLSDVFLSRLSYDKRAIAIVRETYTLTNTTSHSRQ